MKRWLPWLLFALLTRGVAFCFTENVYGDSVVRSWLGVLWVQAPHVIGSFDQGGYQFGPLHLYAVGLASLLPMPLADSGRLVSLVVGVLTVWPLLSLTASMFGLRAAPLAGLVFGCWGLHIQFSTTASGEALNLLLVMTMLCWLQQWFVTKRRVWLLAAALMLNLACACRYDSWLYVPLLMVAIAWRGKSLRSALLFGFASLAFALPWMFGNFVDRGSALFPFTYIDDFHRAWFVSEQAMWGARYRAITLFFWPGTAVVTLTPLMALFAGVGVVSAWRHQRESRWLIMLILVPTVLYTVRSTLLLSFVPLARFTAKEVALLLPFVGVGASALSLKWSARAFRPMLFTALACLVALPLWLAWYTFRTDSPRQNTWRPISPVTTNSPNVMRVADWLRTKATEGQLAIIDIDPHGYDDLQVSFYSGFAYEKVARLRSPVFEQRLTEGTPGTLIRFEGGALETTRQFDDDTFRGTRFVEVKGFAPPIHVYTRGQ